MSQQNVQQRFRPGELVNVAIEGAKVDHHDGDRLVLKLGDAIIRIPVVLPSASGSVRTTRVAPADWPPRAGDVWRSAPGRWEYAGDLWLAGADATDEAGRVHLVTADGQRRYADDLLRCCGPLTLVHREERAL